MRRILIVGVFIICVSGCSWEPVGKLMIASTRNYDTGVTYVLLSQRETGKARKTSLNSIEEAIDNAVQKVPGGEHLRNVTIYKNNKRFRVIGDVWGIRTKN